ncbi:MAG: AAA family ATPase [Rubrivivax sp.]|nr:AAA family ATPase [Rubrivivax sp.]
MSAIPNFKRTGDATSRIDEAMAAATLQSVRLIRGDAVALEPVRWVWRGFLPAGMLTILGGAPGCGKTTIALALAATVTRGGHWPDGSRYAEPGDVLIWSGEDAHPILAARLAAMDADMARVHFVDGVRDADADDGAFDPGRDMALLAASAEGIPGLRLLMLDPIVSAVTGDSHKNAEVRRALQPVVDLARRTASGVLGITHFTKGTAGRDPVERITGSLAFGALARLVLVAAKVKPEPGDEGEPRRVFLRAKSNIGPDDGGFAYVLDRVEVAPEVEGQRVLWGERIEGPARDVLAEAEADAASDGGDSADVAGFLRGLLADGPVPAKAIKADADGAGYSWDQVKRASLRIGAEKRKEGMAGGWVWALPSSEGSTEGSEGRTQKALHPSLPSRASVLPSGVPFVPGNSVADDTEAI